MRSRSVAELAAALAVVVAVPGVAWAAPGDLDPSFGTGGRSPDVFGGVREALALSDGSIVTSQYFPFTVSKTTATGTHDLSFSRTISFGAYDQPAALAVGTGDRIVVVGSTEHAYGTADVGVARLLPDGSFDGSFGAGGKTTFDLGSRDTVTDAAVAADGSIVLVGFGSNPSGGPSHAFVARLEPDGDLDPSFSGDGYTLSPDGDPAAHEYAHAVLLGADGSILVALAIARDGDTYPAHPRLVRLEPDGDLDLSFSGDGIADLEYPGATNYPDLHPGPAGSTYYVAHGRYDAPGSGQVIVRLDSAGEPDPGFSGDGLELLGSDSRSSAVDPQGRLLLAGTSGDLGPLRGFDAEVLRLTTGGAADPAFSGDGRVTADLSGWGASDYVSELVVDPQGRIVIAAETSAFPQAGAALLRYLTVDGPADADADGILDADDRCPYRYGRAKDGGCPVIPTVVSIRYARHIDDFEGVASYGQVEGCVLGARVALYRVRRGRDKRLGRSDTTEPIDDNPYPTMVERRWDVSALPRRGRYYAVLERHLVDDLGICAGARSSTIRIRHRRHRGG